MNFSIAAFSLPLAILTGLGNEPKPIITTVAGTGRAELGPGGSPLEVNIGQPFGVEVFLGNTLLVCEVENHRVLQVNLAGNAVHTLAGNGKRGLSGDGGPAVLASLNEPYEVRLDAGRNLFIVEMRGAVVRRVDMRSGRIETVAGTGEPGFGGDGGLAAKAQLREPHSIALDGRGGLYIADIGNHRVRRVDLAARTIETIAGNGEPKLPADGASAAGTPLLGPRALACDGETLWIALREGHSIWKLDLSSRVLRHVAGSGEKGYRDGGAKEARFYGPKGIALGPRRDLFVADTENQVIRRIDLASGEVTTVAGSGPKWRGYGGDGGPALEAKLDRPHGIAVDALGKIYIGDTGTNRVRRIAAP
jgi:sugar lactone lactonase YvrE